ncbi:methyltransferase FkbM [Microcystis phage Mel-JY01]
MIKAHTSIIGETGYNIHSRNFFKNLDKLIPVKVRNWTVGKNWKGHSDTPHDGEYYMDDQLRTMIKEQTLSNENGWGDYSIYSNYKNNSIEKIHIVLNDNRHHYFWQEYNGISIAYNAWETTRQPDDFFNQLKKFTQVWVPSEWQRQCTIEQGISENKVKVVPEGVDVETFKPINDSIIPNRIFKFVLVGRWDYRKSTKEIIETFKRAFGNSENVKLIVNIDNPFATDGLLTTEDRFEKYNLFSDNIEIVHHLDKNDYVHLLKTADCFISCARGEGWNLPLIEAMACGIPSIYSDWGGQLEYANGRGIPIRILQEVSSDISPENSYYSWSIGAPGNFAEPDFNHLYEMLNDVYSNYSSYKKRALKDSDEIRSIFTWENSAKIAKKYIDELIEHENIFDESIAIVLSHANTPKRKKLLNSCLNVIPMETIISSNYPVDSNVQEKSDWLIYSKDNPILYKDEFDTYGVDYYSWWREESGDIKKEKLLYEHGYAAYQLIRKGIEFAKSLGKKKVHVINYDYILKYDTFVKHEKLLKSNLGVFYKQDFEVDNFCSAFFSMDIDTALQYFTLFSDRESYYKYLPGFNILEVNMHHFYSNVKKMTDKFHVESIDELKRDNQINLEAVGNIIYKDEVYLSDRPFKAIADALGCDKTTYHTYHTIYPLFLDKFRDKKVNILEIGIDEELSVKLWKSYFEDSNIFGIDKNEKYKKLLKENIDQNSRINIFYGDQSSTDDLHSIIHVIPKCSIIVDDGSHVAEHQIKTFHNLFTHVLNPGGVYIIEDIECSYWKPDSTVYGYETGNTNVVDYFSKLNHELNNHYNGEKNHFDIHSITFAPNCIIITKNTNETRVNKEYRFKEKLGKYPETKIQMENKIDISFLDGARVEITGEIPKKYDVKFIDKNTNKVVYSDIISNNSWVAPSRKWFTDWKIEIHDNGEKIVDYDFNLNGKNVLISLESSSLGDTLAWIPYVEEFRIKHNCNVYVTTFLNYLFESEYPNINFITPGTVIDGIHASYRIGWYFDNSGFDFNKNVEDVRKYSLQKTASDILGIDFVEIVPRVIKPAKYKHTSKYVCIANHSTSQAKYWNNPNGWQQVVDYLRGKGYDVFLLSRESDGYMGNKNPNGVIKIDDKNLLEIGSILRGADAFIGLGSGLTWFAWALEVPTILISGFSEPYQEMSNVYRVINNDVCHGCFARELFDRGDWNWCPDHKDTPRQFECTKEITFQNVKQYIDMIV